MKILAVTDQVVESLHSTNVRERFGDVDLVLSCGDLPYTYLEYIATLLGVPCFYVHGNHDKPEYTAAGQVLTRPGGWVDLDGRSVWVKETLLAGLEGSIRYKPEGVYQYTEAQMAHKAWRLGLRLWRNRARYGRYLDVLVTHAPPLGIHDGEDWPHRGFKAYLGLLARYRPRFLIHGHRHIYGPQVRQTRYAETEVVNVYPYHVIEW